MRQNGQRTDAGCSGLVIHRMTASKRQFGLPCAGWNIGEYWKKIKGFRGRQQATQGGIVPSGPMYRGNMHCRVLTPALGVAVSLDGQTFGNPTVWVRGRWFVPRTSSRLHLEY